MKKIFLIVLLFFLTACSIKKHVSKGKLISKQSTFEYGELYKLEDIFKNKDITFTEQYLDVSNLGKNNITINYKKDNLEYSENFTYNVVDTTKPLIWLGKSYTIYVNEDDDLVNKIICADNYDRHPNCYIKGEYDQSIIGSYPLTYVAKDSNGNTQEIDFTLYVKERPVNNFSNNIHEVLDINDVIKEYKTDKTMIGIDVSKHQGVIDWKEVKNAGIEFAMIRLGIGYTDLKLDEQYIANITGALNNNIKVGIYFYSYATTIEEVKDQANFVLKNIKGYDITFPIAFDWENFNGWNAYGLSLYDLRNMNDTFADIMIKNGYKVIQYGSKNYLNAFWSPIKYDTWLAHYITGNTDYDKDFKMWQICNNGKVPGINTDVDIDIYYN